VVYCT